MTRRSWPWRDVGMVLLGVASVGFLVWFVVVVVPLGARSWP